MAVFLSLLDQSAKILSWADSPACSWYLTTRKLSGEASATGDMLACVAADVTVSQKPAIYGLKLPAGSMIKA
ncbi:MAG TPA: hypothetical protein VHD63_17040, partial [Ktedonobacteraceae bacterium]|nr:hypothetical protein [Ktedonobacteraceae bacterium]